MKDIQIFQHKINDDPVQEFTISIAEDHKFTGCSNFGATIVLSAIAESESPSIDVNILILKHKEGGIPENAKLIGTTFSRLSTMRFWGAENYFCQSDILHVFEIPCEEE